MKDKVIEELESFTGTENYYLDYLNIKITDGIKYLMEAGKCGWLISDIASIWHTKNLQGFWLIELKKIEDSEAILTIREDSNIEPIHKQKYEYTDFWENTGLKELKIYLIDGVLLLPSEY